MTTTQDDRPASGCCAPSPCSAFLRVLVACEYSGTVRDAFAAMGHDAMSCDLLPSEKPGKHYQGDVRDVLDDGWDLMICHPPCTYLSVSGIHWNNRGRGWEETEKALDFVRLLMGANIPRIALENPVSIISSRIRKPDQIIHPHQFGHDASKATCLWLKNLPKLRPTENVPPRIVNGKPRWANQTDGGQNKLAPSDDRWKLRSTTYPGIAAAMAFHWENKSKTPHGGRIAYSFAEFADKVGKERTWVYRNVKKGRIRAITGYGAAMIPASEIDRIFSSVKSDNA